MIEILAGVYAIKNLLNNKHYVGISFNILRRWDQHIKNAFVYKKPGHLYNSIRKYGLENFSFNILELTKDASRECFWIKELDSIANGYNIRNGGEVMKYDSHPRHKLTMQDVIDIRKRYARGERPCLAYTLYSDKISFSGFEKIWYNSNWVGVMPEVYTRSTKR